MSSCSSPSPSSSWGLLTSRPDDAARSGFAPPSVLPLFSPPSSAIELLSPTSAPGVDLGGLPNPNPTGFPMLPTPPAGFPNPPNPVPPNGLAFGGEPKAFEVPKRPDVDEDAEFPKAFVLEAGTADGEPKVNDPDEDVGLPAVPNADEDVPPKIDVPNGDGESEDGSANEFIVDVA